MVYPEYLKIKSTFYSFQKRFEELLLSKEKIFADTLPSGIRYDKDVVQTSPNDPMLKYVENLDCSDKGILERLGNPAETQGKRVEGVKSLA